MASSSSSGSSGGGGGGGGGGIEIIDGPSDGFCVIARVRAGGDDAHEFSVGRDAANDCTTGQRAWAAAGGGIDSGDVATKVMCGPGGGAAGPSKIDVAGGAPQPATYQLAGYADVRMVQIQAKVTQANAKFAFGELRVTFENPGAGQQLIVVPAATAPVADTTGGQGGAAASQTIQVTPSNAGYTKVTVEGTVRLVSQGAAPADADSIQGTVYVFAGNCTALAPATSA